MRSDQGEAAGDGGERARWLFPMYALILLGGATVLTSSVVTPAEWPPSQRSLVWFAVLAAGFALAQALAVQVDLRRHSLRVTLTEIPLVLGLLTLPGPVVIAAFAVVVVIAGLARRDAPAKLGLNLAVSLLVTSLAVLAIAVVSAAAPQGPPWAVVLAAVVLANAAGAVAVLGGVMLLPGGRNLSSPVWLTLNMFLVGVLSAIVGVACFALYAAVPAGGVLAGLGVLMLLIIYRTYYTLLREQRDLELLNTIGLEVAGLGRSADLAGTADTGETGDRSGDAELEHALQLVREQLNASRVVLHRRSAGRTPGEPASPVVAGAPLPSQPSVRETDTLLERYATGGVQRVQADEADRWGKRLCRVRRVGQVVLAPLHGSEDVLGLIEVHERPHRLRGFSAADLRLVETLASHLTTAVDNRRLLGRLRHDAYVDELTGLANRPGFRAAAFEQLRSGRACAVVVVELDLLSSVTDALGQAWGQRVLAAAADRLRAAGPDGLVAGRLEGERFAALLLDMDDEDAMHRARALRDALAAPYPVDQFEVECNPAVGVASSSVEPHRDVDVLIQRADVALHEARAGNYRVRSYARSMGEVFVRRFQLATQFRQALELGQVELAFQPTLALATGRVTGAEALVRWEHPDLGAVDPEEFVAVVETAGLVDLLTDFVLDRALAQCAALRAAGHELSIAVNLSARTLAEPEFPDRVAAALQRHALPASKLGLELTESAVMSDPERALPVLQALSDLGVRVALDDFGTGYSSLAYLRRLPVGEVKIDKSFVLGMSSDPGDGAVVRAIVELAHSLGLRVTAEGVEQDATRDRLVEMGCDTAQGFLIARPLTGHRLHAWLDQRTRPGGRTGRQTALGVVR